MITQENFNKIVTFATGHRETLLKEIERAIEWKIIKVDPKEGWDETYGFNDESYIMVYTRIGIEGDKKLRIFCGGPGDLAFATKTHYESSFEAMKIFRKINDGITQKELIEMGIVRLY